MRMLETRIPPLVVLLLVAGVAWLGARYWPSLTVDFSGQSMVALVLLLVGVIFNLGPKIAFARAGTTVNPLKPESSASLLTSGIYRYTRNPMYLGQTAMLLGWVIYLGDVMMLVVVPAFMLYITRFQIQPEERQLSALFAEQYAAYARRVRRWL